MAALLAALRRRLPQARRLAGSGVPVGQPISRAGDPLPALEAVAPRAPHSRSARRALARIERGQSLPRPSQEALWGYESVRLVLDAIRRSQHGSRPASRDAVIREALTPQSRQSPLGSYSVRPSGAVSGMGLALYRLENGRFEMVQTLR